MSLLKRNSQMDNTFAPPLVLTKTYAHLVAWGDKGKDTSRPSSGPAPGVCHLQTSTRPWPQTGAWHCYCEGPCHRMAKQQCFHQLLELFRFCAAVPNRSAIRWPLMWPTRRHDCGSWDLIQDLPTGHPLRSQVQWNLQIYRAPCYVIPVWRALNLLSSHQFNRAHQSAQCRAWVLFFFFSFSSRRSHDSMTQGVRCVVIHLYLVKLRYTGRLPKKIWGIRVNACTGPSIPRLQVTQKAKHASKIVWLGCHVAHTHICRNSLNMLESFELDDKDGKDIFKHPCQADPSRLIQPCTSLKKIAKVDYSKT